MTSFNREVRFLIFRREVRRWERFVEAAGFPPGLSFVELRILWRRADRYARML